MSLTDELKSRSIPHEQIGPCLLINADCLEVLPLIERVDAVVTDPPYGIGFAAQPTKWQRRAGHVASDWDDKRPDASILIGLADKTAVWGGNYFELPVSRGWLSWFKPDAPPSMGSVEMCWTSEDMNTRMLHHSISATNRERVGHPTQKPIAVMRWTIEEINAGNTILDPFMGSGTTGVACIRLGRQFIGIELEKKYYNIARERISKEWRIERSRFKFEPEPEPVQNELFGEATQ